MKKILAGLMAATILAGVAHAATFSKNAVGFINVEVDAEELVCLTIPFVNMDSPDGSWAFTDTQIAADATPASQVYFWENSAWQTVTKGRVTASNPTGFNTNKRLVPGEAFFFRPKSAMTITMSGEVPDEDSQAVDITGAANLSAVGNPYPVPVKFTDTTLAASANTASQVYFWYDGAWNAVTKGRVTAANPTGFNTDREIQPGEGIFFRTNAKDDSYQWTVEKPYDYP